MTVSQEERKQLVEEWLASEERHAALKAKVRAIGFPRKLYGLSTRVEEIAQRYVAGETLEELGKAYEVSRERIRQILSQWSDATPEMSYRARQKRRLFIQFEERTKNAIPCSVCGAWVLRRVSPQSRVTTCSKVCWRFEVSA